ncbi:fimbrial protein [Serratia sp. M24T3]|uniref:fimbrial protein n=1 Tax=Serratia sp. M24T3 TaxID=932213 RepID=UPI0005683F87|nr:fimbrial protein [Serratia sp. M24T3]
MNKSALFSLIIITLTSILCFGCQADSLGMSNVRFSANIVTWSCTISSASQNITVNLGQWNTRSYKSSGITTTPTYFSISLNNCANSSVTTTFSGKSDPTNDQYLALDSTSTVENVAIELLDSDKTELPLNKESHAVVVGSSGNATLGFYARYITTAKAVQAGTADAQATFVINYR